MEQGAACGRPVLHAPLSRFIRMAVHAIYGVGEQPPVRLSERRAGLAIALPLDSSPGQRHLFRLQPQLAGRSVGCPPVPLDRQPSLLEAPVYIPVLNMLPSGYTDGRDSRAYVRAVGPDALPHAAPSRTARTDGLGTLHGIADAAVERQSPAEDARRRQLDYLAPRRHQPVLHDAARRPGFCGIAAVASDPRTSLLDNRCGT